MITLQSAGKRFGPKLLFENISWLITPEDRTGLVGANGTGKTTLLKILAGYEPLEYGERQATKGITIGYLPQDGLSLRGRTVFAECLSVFDDLKQMERDMEALTQQMAILPHDGPEFDAVSEQFHLLENRFSARDGYAVESQVGMVLDGLGFPKSDWHRFTEEFSGGWQMRIALGKLLLQKPNLLLLDEPTNHLDLEARTWLENYLQNYPFAFIMISHDRHFLDMTVRRIVEIWNKGMHVYSGNYEKYLKQKQERRLQLEAAYRNQQEKVEQLESFINRFRAQATKAKQVQSRIKELERIERIEIPPEEKAIHFSFPQPTASGRVVAEFQRVAKHYGEKRILENVNFLIERGDRIALVGPNGAGKSTLIKLLSGAEPLTSGTYQLGHNVDVDYFAQDQYKELDPDSRLLDDLTSVAGQKTQTELRSLLGCFLFSEDDVFKKIGVLSGGERNRYALAKLLLRPANFLLLDEPTNHLDMRAKDVLLESLEAFTGTLVFVSHDRYFIEKLATKIYEVGNGGIHVYPGTYEQFQQMKAGRAATPELGRANAIPAVDTTADIPADDQPKKRTNPQKRRQLETECAQMEEAIAKHEAAIKDLETQLANFVSTEETVRVSKALDATRTALEEVMEKWEEATVKLEEM